MKASPFFTLNISRCAIGDGRACTSVQGNTDRKARPTIIPNDLNAADGLASRPLPDGFKALFSQRALAQANRFEFYLLK